MNKIYVIILIIVIIYLYSENKSVRESMANTEENLDDKIKNHVNNIYKADVEAIRNLANISKELQNGSLKIPGNLTIDGNFNVKGTAKRNGSTFALDSTLSSATNSLTSKINSTESRLTTKLNAHKTLIDENTKERVKPGVVWGVNSNQQIFWRNENGSKNTPWNMVGGGLSNLSVGKEYIWGVNGNNNIFKCKKPCRGNWEQQSGGLRQIATSN
jgi:hypothetical protein